MTIKSQTVTLGKSCTGGNSFTDGKTCTNVYSFTDVKTWSDVDLYWHKAAHCCYTDEELCHTDVQTTLVHCCYTNEELH